MSSPFKIEELNLDNCKATSVDGLTDKFVNLEVLSLNNVGLTSLRHFPHLPKLRKVNDTLHENGLCTLYSGKFGFLALFYIIH